MSKIDSSGIRKVFDLAAKMKDPINLSIGQPDFDVPQPAKNEAIAAIQEGFNRYTLTQGIPELREAVSQLMRDTRGWSPEDVLITSGVSGGIMLAVAVLVDPGDEVIIPDPHFMMYSHLARLFGGVPVYVDTYPDFRMTAERIEPVITPRSRVLFVNSPSNPTGVISRDEELADIADLARRHNLTVITDEVYSDFCYDRPFVSIIKHLAEALLLSGFSKTYAFTGWRLGYACGSARIVQEMTKLQQFSFVCAPSMVQRAGIKALATDVSPQLESYRRKRDLISDGLAESFELVRPEGAFYLFPKVPWGQDDTFVRAAIEANCLVIPGSVFSQRHTHFRISYATTDRQLERGIEVLNRLARRGG